jgi:hypothetical protein
MKIIPLSEGAFTVDKTKHFIPFDKQKDVLSKEAPAACWLKYNLFVSLPAKM